MAKIVPITEHYQHFLAEMKERFWGDLDGRRKLGWKRALETESEGERDRLRDAGVRPATSAAAAAIPQRLLRAGLCDPSRDDPAAHRACPRQELSAPRRWKHSSAGRRKWPC